MKYLFVIIFSLNSFHFAQVCDKDYDLLARYSILKYALEKGFHDNKGDSIFLSGSISDVENIIKSNNYNYELDSLFEIDNFWIISIVDKVNFQLHCYNFSVFAIDQSANYDTRYYALDRSRFLEFINSELYAKIPKNRYHELINLYNKLFSYLNRCNKEIIFYSEENKKDFTYLDGFFRFDDLKKTENYYQNLYYIKNEKESIIEYHHILYFFEPKGIRIEDFLLFKIKV